MEECTVRFVPQDKTVSVPRGTSLLEAVSEARITINNLCGGDGICGRCRMVIREGEVSGNVSDKLTREEIRGGYVLACMTIVEGDLVVEIPKETFAKEKTRADRDAERFRDFRQAVSKTEYVVSPLVKKIHLALDEPSLADNTADYERLKDELCRRTGSTCSVQMGLKIIRSLPAVLRDSGFDVTVTVGERRDVAEIMDVEPGDREAHNYLVVVDMGTTTIVAHLLRTGTLETIDAKACFNSQGIYGREVTRRMISAEKRGPAELQKMLVNDINGLVESMAEENGIHLKDITAVVCAGNTAMGHFLLGLPTDSIRRNPYVAASVEPPPVRAAEVGIEISPRGLLYLLPGISAWVGSDITAGILATGMHRSEAVSLLMDVGTNGEIVIGNRDWLVAVSASAGPALEGASVSCGMRAEPGAIEKVYTENGDLHFVTIDGVPPVGICGSGIIDAVSALLRLHVINRSGRIVGEGERVTEVNGVQRFLFTGGDKPIYLAESDIENVITAKAAIFAAMNILLKRLDLDFDDIDRYFIAGAFGNYIDVDNARAIGLLPSVEKSKIQFVGNTSMRGAKICALYREAFNEVAAIRRRTTYYDLMGAHDYVEEFQKALFLPHTDIEMFAVKGRG